MLGSGADFTPVFVVLVIAAIIFLAIWGFYAEAKRRKRLAAWARRGNFSFTPSKDYGFDERFPGFDCLDEGSSRYAFNIASGERDDRSVLCFDYHYETYSRDSKGRRTTHHHYFSAVILGTNVPLKQLFLRPEGFFDKIKEFVGFDDIDFESAEFSRRFYVKAPDRRWAYDVIHQRTMEFLLESPKFSIELDRRHVILYRSSRFSEEDFEDAIRVGSGILDRFPDYLVRQQLGEVEG